VTAPEEEIEEGYANPDNFPDFDEVDSESIEEEEGSYNPTEVDPDSDNDEEE
jgi:hypothetical protein